MPLTPKRGRPRKHPKPETTYDASPPLTPARQVMVNLDERTLKRLDELAAAARLSRSAMVRRLVAEARPESVSSPCASTP